jgi:predicted signal transduction protein with EAL and GGDEF domain
VSPKRRTFDTTSGLTAKRVVTQASDTDLAAARRRPKRHTLDTLCLDDTATLQPSVGHLIGGDGSGWRETSRIRRNLSVDSGA